MMIPLTDGAKALYADYISKVRARLFSSGAADADEILADLQEHVSEELADTPEPATHEAMRAVLERLGSPDQWVNADDLPWWRKVLMRLRTGPEDWRLVYFSFVALIVGALPISFILSRAAIAAQKEPLAPAQKWLAYPSLIIVYVVILGIVLIPVPIIGGAVGYELSFASLTEYSRLHGTKAPTPTNYPPILKSLGLNRYTDVRAGVVGVWMGVATGGAWLMLLGGALLFRGPRRFAACVFAPFLDESSKRWAVTILLFGLLLGAIALAVGYWRHLLFHPAACPWEY